MDLRNAKIGGPAPGGAVKDEQRAPVTAHDDLEVAPADLSRELGTGKRLEPGFLRGETRRVTAGRLRAAAGVIDLTEGEQPLQCAVALPLNETLDARDVDEAQLTAWMRSLNDLRLILGTKLDVSEDEDPMDIAADAPDAQERWLYLALGALLEDVVDALAG